MQKITNNLWTLNSMFKKILISLFPNNLPFLNWNPAWLFVSFISARQFFGIVNRKMVENFRLNMFDINIDPFDAKIWLGDRPMILLKDIENYYSYCCVANFNWQKIYTPNVLSLLICMVCSVYFENIFTSSQEKYFNWLINTIYIMSFLFWSRIKVFPENPSNDKNKDVKWMLEVFVNVFDFVMSQTYQKYSKKTILKLKNNLIKENINVFFMLSVYFFKINQILECGYIQSSELYSRLFYDDFNNAEIKKDIDFFVLNYKKNTTNSQITEVEKSIINKILPAEVVIKYIFLQNSSIAIARTICERIFPKNITQNYINSFFENDSKFEEFIQSIFNHKVFKEWFMNWMEKFIRIKFRDNVKYNVEDEEELEDFYSTVENTEDINVLKKIKIPKKLKDESSTIEKLINFYITFLWWFGVSRWDSIFARIFRKDIIKNIVKKLTILENKPSCLHFYGGMMYIYSKNLFYYKYTYENIRMWKDKFYLPYSASFGDIQSNMFIINLFNESFFATLIQDMMPIEVKTYIRNKDIINFFKEKYSKTISSWIQDDSILIENAYWDLDNLLWLEWKLIEEIKNWYKSRDIINLKNKLYSIDFWFIQSIYKILLKSKDSILKKYWNLALAWILSIIKDTAFGFVMYVSYMIQKWIQIEEIVFIIRMYCEWLLITTEIDSFDFAEAIQTSMNQNIEMIKIRIKTDENPTFLHFWYENRYEYRKNITNFRNKINLSWEDVLWLKSYTKNITYYNKRFILP